MVWGESEKRERELGKKKKKTDEWRETRKEKGALEKKKKELWKKKKKKKGGRVKEKVGNFCGYVNIWENIKRRYKPNKCR